MRKGREGERPIKTKSYETRVVKSCFGQTAFHYDGVVFLEAGIVYTAFRLQLGGNNANWKTLSEDEREQSVACTAHWLYTQTTC